MRSAQALLSEAPGNLAASLVPVSSVSLRRISMGVKPLLPDDQRTHETSRGLVVEWIVLHTVSMCLGKGTSSHVERDFIGPPVGGMIGAAIEDDQGPSHVIDLAMQS
jgi:hypothetical protein